MFTGWTKILLGDQTDILSSQVQLIILSSLKQLSSFSFFKTRSIFEGLMQFLSNSTNPLHAPNIFISITSMNRVFAIRQIPKSRATKNPQRILNLISAEMGFSSTLYYFIAASPILIKNMQCQQKVTNQICQKPDILQSKCRFLYSKSKGRNLAKNACRSLASF